MEALITDENMSGQKLIKTERACGGVIAEINKNKTVFLVLLLRICECLEFDFSDIIEAVPKDSSSKYGGKISVLTDGI